MIDEDLENSELREHVPYLIRQAISELRALRAEIVALREAVEQPAVMPTPEQIEEIAKRSYLAMARTAYEARVAKTFADAKALTDEVKQ